MITPVPGKPNLLLGAYDLATLGYGAEEFFVSGSASSYSSEETADYTTRIVVLRPTDEAGFNGTVIVEWLNVSGGIDAPAVWFMAHREIARAGFAYVAVSAQQVGIQGGASLVGADMSLKAQDPERYSRLHHPGDAFSYDIYSQVGRLLRDGAVDGLDPEIRSGGGRVAIGGLPDDLRQRRRSTRRCIRRIPGPFPLRTRRAAGRRQHLRSRPRPGSRPCRSEAICASHSSRSSPKPMSSAAFASAITLRGSPTTGDCGRGRFPAPPTPTTTRSASASSTTGPCRWSRSCPRTRPPTN